VRHSLKFRVRATIASIRVRHYIDFRRQVIELYGILLLDI